MLILLKINMIYIIINALLLKEILFYSQTNI